MKLVEDDKLPEDVVRMEYSDSMHTLCCVECGVETPFNPRQPGSIGKPLYALLLHECPQGRD